MEDHQSYPLPSLYLLCNTPELMYASVQISNTFIPIAHFKLVNFVFQTSAFFVPENSISFISHIVHTTAIKIGSDFATSAI
jgi:hypothetical protein